MDRGRSKEESLTCCYRCPRSSLASWLAHTGSRSTLHRVQRGELGGWFQQCDLDPTVHWAFHENDNHDVDDDPDGSGDGPPLTDIDSRKTSSHSDCGAIQDIQIVDGYYPSDPAPASYYCLIRVADPDGPSDMQSCAAAQIALNLAYYAIPEVGAVTEQAMCQEVGHALSLDHWDVVGTHPYDGRPGSCMIQAISGSRGHLIHRISGTADGDMYEIDARHNPSSLD